MHFRAFSQSLLTRLMLVGLGLVLFGSVVLYLTMTHFLRADLTTVVEDQQLAMATYVAHDIEDKIRQRQMLLEHLGSALPHGILTHPAQLQAWMKTRYAYQTLFSGGLYVVDRHGMAIADFPVAPGRVRTHYGDRDYVQAGLAGKPFIGRPVIGRATHMPVLPMSIPIMNDKGMVLALLVGITALDSPGFLEIMQVSRIGKTSGGFLLVSTRDKLFIGASQPGLVMTPTPAPGINALHDRAMTGYRGAGITVNAKGIEEISAMVSVGYTDWFIVARLPTSEAFATVGRLKYFLLKTTILKVIIFLIMAFVGLYSIIRPLMDAALRAERMTQGDAPLEPLPVVRNDEVGHLVSAFNRLLGKLNGQQTELTRIAQHDTLTGLPNRGLLTVRLRQALADAGRLPSGQVGIMYMDLDGFKHINDTFGHEAGDEVLREVTRRFTRVIRKTDTLARIGGDEFVLLLGNLDATGQTVASQVAVECITVLKTPFLIDGTTCTLGVSIGIALGNSTSVPHDLLLAADRAMYQAKKGGRDRHVIDLQDREMLSLSAKR